MSGPSPAPRRIDLNADVGERDEANGVDDAILDVVSSASVACGGHAGSRTVMEEVVRAADRRDVAIGAHPSYPDREGFGRRAMQISPSALADTLVAQIGTLADVAAAAGTRLRYVKAHGALYNAMADDQALATVVVDAVRSVGDLVVLVRAGTPAVGVVEGAGLTVAREAFCDRAYRANGDLLSRDRPGAVLADPATAAARAVSLACAGGLDAVDGSWLAMTADSLCVHGDTPGAAAVAAAVRQALDGAGVAVAAFAP